MMLRGVGGIYTGMREEFQDWEERKGKRGAGRGGTWQQPKSSDS